LVVHTSNMVETAFDHLRMGCLLVFMELLHFNSTLTVLYKQFKGQPT